MKTTVEIIHDRYTRIDYRMFDLSPRERWVFKIARWVSIPFIYPLVLIARLSPETGFKMASEFLSLIPTTLGFAPRYEFYRRTLRACGSNVFISFGAVFYYPQIQSNLARFGTWAFSSKSSWSRLWADVVLSRKLA